MLLRRIIIENYWRVLPADCDRNGGAELIIRDTTILDVGYYQCHGRNEFGRTSSSLASVIINGKRARNAQTASIFC